MNGKVYSTYTNILSDSFGGMTKDYAKSNQTKKMNRIISLYIGLFGIPEIGFQVRYLYFKKALKKIKLPKNPNILDAGSGIGFYLYSLKNSYPTSTLTGYEIDSVKLKFTESDFKQLSEARIVKQDLTTMKDRNKFNLIVNIDVLEHIKIYKKVIENFYSALQKDGYLYIHTPSVNQKRFFPREFENWQHEEHVREGFEKKKLEKDLKLSGFRIVKSVYTHGFFGSIAWELNHIFLKKSVVLAAITFPFLYFFAFIDSKIDNKNGLCISILVKK